MNSMALERERSHKSILLSFQTQITRTTKTKDPKKESCAGNTGDNKLAIEGVAEEDKAEKKPTSENRTSKVRRPQTGTQQQADC